MTRKMKAIIATAERNKVEGELVSRDKDRIGMRVTEHGTFSRLQPGMVVEYHGEEHLVEMVNECRARIVPLNKKRKVVQFTNKKGETTEFTPEITGGPVSISPNSDLRILRK